VRPRDARTTGFVDDVEFATGSPPDFFGGGSSSSRRSIQVRSSSRSGVTDFGVNAIRLNYLAASLRAQGWACGEVTKLTHPDYMNAANEARDATFDEDRRKLPGYEAGEKGFKVG
jgi:hypothetical protein